MQLDIVWNSPTYNAYATVAEIDELIAAYSVEYGSDFGWSALLEDLDQTQKSDMIIRASWALFSTKFRGTKNAAIVPAAYKLHFPRSGLKYPGGGDVPEIMPGEVDPRAPNEIRQYVALWCLQSLYKKTTDVNGSLKSKTVEDVTETYGTAQRDFTVDALNPILAIPVEWLVSQSTLGFGGVGSIGAIRSL